MQHIPPIRSADAICHGETGMPAELEESEALARCDAEALDSTEHANILRATALADATTDDESRISGAHFEKFHAPFFSSGIRRHSYPSA